MLLLCFTLCKQCVKCHIYIIPINPQGRTTRKVILSLSHGQENKDSERMRNKQVHTASNQKNQDSHGRLPESKALVQPGERYSACE